MTASVTIRGVDYYPIPNPVRKNKDQSERSLFDHTIEYLKGSDGVFRCLQALERVSRAASLVLKEMGSNLSSYFHSAASGLTAWMWLAIPRLPAVTKSGWAVISGLGASKSSSEPGLYRTTLRKIHDLAEAIAMWGYSLSLICGNLAFKVFADFPNLVGDFTDLVMAGDDYRLAQDHLGYIDPKNPGTVAIHRRFLDTLREASLRIVKSAASVFSGAVGILSLGLGGPLVPSAALLGIALLSTSAAIGSYFYKATSDYELVDFFRKPALS